MSTKRLAPLCNRLFARGGMPRGDKAIARSEILRAAGKQSLDRQIGELLRGARNDMLTERASLSDRTQWLPPFGRPRMRTHLGTATKFQHRLVMRKLRLIHSRSGNRRDSDGVACRSVRPSGEIVRSTGCVRGFTGRSRVNCLTNAGQV